MNENYARQIARDWNVKDSGAGYVTRFAVRKLFLAKYPVQKVGSSIHQELRIPAEELAAMNENIVGLIEIIAESKAGPIMNQILFYRITDPYGEFSNFSAHIVTLKGKQWPTVEHYFQAQKFAGTEHEESVRQAKSPMIAARMGRSRQRPLRADWETVNEGVMREALYAEFTQHPGLRSLLLATGDAVIIEHTRNDRYWGDGGDGTGKNRLGELLMELRAKFRAEESGK